MRARAHAVTASAFGSDVGHRTARFGDGLTLLAVSVFRPSIGVVRIDFETQGS
jgi:hypothetical protein